MEGDVEYAFRHALTREVAYASLPKASRAHLHARFAQWLEDAGGGRDEHAPLLAHHFAEAARPEDADLAWSGDDETVARIHYAGETSEVTMQSHWRDIDGQPKIVHAGPVD